MVLWFYNLYIMNRHRPLSDQNFLKRLIKSQGEAYCDAPNLNGQEGEKGIAADAEKARVQRAVAFFLSQSDIVETSYTSPIR
jgi:hypothetical protein